jgi:hypothetical protein
MSAPATLSDPSRRNVDLTVLLTVAQARIGRQPKLRIPLGILEVSIGVQRPLLQRASGASSIPMEATDSDQQPRGRPQG